MADSIPPPTNEHQFYYLRWHNHKSNFGKILDELIELDSRVDCTIIVDDQVQLKAHRLVLAANSKYFQKILQDVPLDHCNIIMPGVEADEMCALLEYMYTGEVNIRQSQFSRIVHVAKQLKVKGLCDINTKSTAYQQAAFNAVPQNTKTNVATSPNCQHFPETKSHKRMKFFTVSGSDRPISSNVPPLSQNSPVATDKNKRIAAAHFNENTTQPNTSNFSTNVGKSNSKRKVKTKRSILQYPPSAMLSAIQSVRDGMSVYAASRIFAVPNSTLYHKVKKLGIQSAATKLLRMRRNLKNLNVTKAAEAKQKVSLSAMQNPCDLRLAVDQQRSAASCKNVVSQQTLKNQSGDTAATEPPFSSFTLALAVDRNAAIKHLMANLKHCKANNEAASSSLNPNSNFKFGQHSMEHYMPNVERIENVPIEVD